MMKNASEKAMALVDGQLAPAEAPALVEELARNGALVVELQTYLAMGRSRIAKPYEAKRVEPVPAWLVDTVMRAPDGRSAKPLTHSRALLGRLKSSYGVPGWSLAVSPALAAVLVALAAWLVVPPSSQGGLFETNLGNTLERTPSGGDTALAMLRPVLSFRSKDGAWCRQYEVRYATKQVSHGLACRTNVGNWQLVMSTSPGPIGFTPAGADPRKMIDDRATSMMSGAPLSETEEGARINNAWSPL